MLKKGDKVMIMPGMAEYEDHYDTIYTCISDPWKTDAGDEIILLDKDFKGGYATEGLIKIPEDSIKKGDELLTALNDLVDGFELLLTELKTIGKEKLTGQRDDNKAYCKEVMTLCGETKEAIDKELQKIEDKYNTELVKLSEKKEK